jgi:putative transposase
VKFTADGLPTEERQRTADGRHLDRSDPYHALMTGHGGPEDMARLARLEVPGLPHLLLQRGHNGEAMARDDADARALLAAIHQASRDQAVAVHAYGIWPQGFLLLVTPHRPRALGLLMQSVGRRYAAHFNRRHLRSGGLWDGRFRATVLDPEAHVLDAQLLVESRAGALAVVDLRHAAGGLVRSPVGGVGWVAATAQRSSPAAGRAATPGSPVLAAGSMPDGMPDAGTAGSAEPAWSSAPHHLGMLRDPLVQDTPGFWALGNTPFDRESAWRRRLEQGLPAAVAGRLADSVDKGWVIGDSRFAGEVAQLTQRRTTPLPRGRPRRPAADSQDADHPAAPGGAQGALSGTLSTALDSTEDHSRGSA